MKVEEVRIGNFYNPQKPLQIDANDFMNMWTNDLDYEPIPLTEEWLLKFGFEKKALIWLHPSTLNFEIYNRAKLEGVTHFIAGRSQKDYFLGISEKLEYVHQLQNLYFALTGEELKINSEKTANIE